MRASDLIKYLEQMIQLDGDLPILVMAEHGQGCIEPARVVQRRMRNTRMTGYLAVGAREDAEHFFVIE